jgi:beta-lactamase class A
LIERTRSYRGNLLNEKLTSALIKQLSTLKKDSYLSFDLPTDVQIADKPGSLDGVRTDTGIIFAKNRPFVISVMTAYERDEQAAERAIGKVAFEAYRYFEMRGKVTEYGRVLPPIDSTTP